jgi:hypothetical protein
MINLIMHSVTSVKTNVKWHGARIDRYGVKKYHIVGWETVTRH